jgi:hypothetical protein
MGHGLRGDELERAYREALDGPEGGGCRSGASGRRKGEQREGKATDRRPVPSQDDRREEGHAQADPYQALERLRKARGRLRAAREETGSEEKRSKGLLPGRTETVTVRTGAEERLLGRCRREVEQARDALESALNAQQ